MPTVHARKADAMVDVHRLKFHPILLFLLLPFCAHAQRRTITQQLHWSGYFNTLKLNERWAVSTDIQERRFFNPDAHQQFGLRSMIRRDLGRGMDVALGGALFLQGANDPNAASQLVRPELRPHAEIVRKSKGAWYRFNQRFRTEARFFHREEGGELTAGYSFTSFRVRYQPALEIPILRDADAGAERLAFKLAGELFLRSHVPTFSDAFDQGRLHASFIIGITPGLTIDIGYMNMYQRSIGGEVFYDRHLLRVVIQHRIDLTRPRPTSTTG
ncbi:MAG: DUF2490 domain-containing protein [Flavobacteriales bacterium]|nr:DUF2490 domain-containing protein [Flavobacteriales bacterium]